MGIDIQKNTNNMDAFAMILDINGFAKIVSNPNSSMIAEFTRDVLYGGIKAVEQFKGEVVGFVGDAFLAILTDFEMVNKCCITIAKDIEKQCEYITTNSDAFPFAPKGPSIKIGIEYGNLNISEISSKFLGPQKLFVGEAINYAARIIQADRGNRCLFGPKAYEMGLCNYVTKDHGYYEVKGKENESIYKYYKLDLSNIWIEGESEETYWG